MAKHVIPALNSEILRSEHKDRLEHVLKAKKSRGRDIYAKYLQGKPITPLEGLLARCADCMAMYDDGLVDCEQPLCAAYPWMPYRRKKRSEK